MAWVVGRRVWKKRGRDTFSIIHHLFPINVVSQRPYKSRVTSIPV